MFNIQKECASLGISKFAPFTNQMLPTDMPRIQAFYERMEEVSLQKDHKYDSNYKEFNYIIPTGHLIISKVLIT